MWLAKTLLQQAFLWAVLGVVIIFIARPMTSDLAFGIAISALVLAAAVCAAVFLWRGVKVTLER